MGASKISTSMTIEERKRKLMHKTYKMMFGILLIFGIPAVPAFFAGRWLDTTYDIRPNGSILMIVVAAVISWTIMIRLYKKLRAELRAIEEDEKQEQHVEASSE